MKSLKRSDMDDVRVLYVEDELSLGRIVKESLQRRGFDVIMESDGAKVLSVFRETNPALCVLDVMLPNKDGFEIAEEIRAIDPYLPILFLTAKTQTSDLVMGFAVGGNDYIRKPFSMEELIVRINNLLDKRERPVPSNADYINIGRFQFYYKKHLLLDGGKEKKLSYRESELLKILYEGRQGVIERKKILNLLWGNDSFFNSRNLDVYITRLRSCLKDDQAVQILTIKGIGYRFVLG